MVRVEVDALVVVPHAWMIDGHVAVILDWKRSAAVMRMESPQPLSVFWPNRDSVSFKRQMGSPPLTEGILECDLLVELLLQAVTFVVVHSNSLKVRGHILLTEGGVTCTTEAIEIPADPRAITEITKFFLDRVKRAREIHGGIILGVIGDNWDVFNCARMVTGRLLISSTGFVVITMWGEIGAHGFLEDGRGWHQFVVFG